MIDTHAHLFLSDAPPEALISQAQAAGVTDIVNVAIDLKTSAQSIAWAHAHSMLRATAGIHPCEREVPALWSDRLGVLLQDEQVVAVGETGLDLVRSSVPLPVQLARLTVHFEWAERMGLPVILHCRGAADAFIPVVKAWPHVIKVFHCFSDSLAFLDAVDSPTTYYSFTGNITYPSSVPSRAAVTALPLSKFMLETDMPYLVPQRYKGQPNQSAYIGEVAAAVAALKGVGVEAVVASTTQLANRIYVRP